MGFSNYIVTKTGFLVRQFIRSFNYVAGSAGWTVNKDGSAEFNNLTVRGTFNGTDFIINAAGAFYYEGTPAANNLRVATIPGSVSVTDAFGNEAFPGENIYGFDGTNYWVMNIFGSSVQVPFISWATSASGQNGFTLGNRGSVTPHISGSGGTLTFNNLLTTMSSLTVNDALTATGGTAASPTVITTDTWHNVTPPTGFSGLLRYRLRAENDVEVEAQMAVGTTAGTGTITLITLDAAHTPAQTQRDSCGVFCNGIPSSAGVQGILDLRWSADPAGTFTLRSFPGGAANTGITECSFNARYALD